MKRRHPLKVLFYISLTIVVLLIGYKAYLNLFAPEFEAEHIAGAINIPLKDLNADTTSGLDKGRPVIVY